MVIADTSTARNRHTLLCRGCAEIQQWRACHGREKKGQKIRVRVTEPRELGLVPAHELGRVFSPVHSLRTECLAYIRCTSDVHPEGFIAARWRGDETAASSGSQGTDRRGMFCKSSIDRSFAANVVLLFFAGPGCACARACARARVQFKLCGPASTQACKHGRTDGCTDTGTHAQMQGHTRARTQAPADQISRTENPQLSTVYRLC